jgi:hypothetical protein
MSAHTPGALTPHGEKVQRVINLLLASSCFGRDVCGALPCACAETLVQHFEINADLLAALEAILTADNAPLVLSDSHSVALLDAARAAIAKATTAMTKYEAREIARAAIEKVKSW